MSQKTRSISSFNNLYVDINTLKNQNLLSNSKYLNLMKLKSWNLDEALVQLTAAVKTNLSTHEN